MRVIYIFLVGCSLFMLMFISGCATAEFDKFLLLISLPVLRFEKPAIVFIQMISKNSLDTRLEPWLLHTCVDVTV